jgi:hypothetical protein
MTRPPSQLALRCAGPVGALCTCNRPPPFACESSYGYQEEYVFSNDEDQ